MSVEQRYGREPHEQLVIGLAREKGAARVAVPFTPLSGPITTVTFCGTCGRMVCHPDCPKGGGA